MKKVLLLVPVLLMLGVSSLWADQLSTKEAKLDNGMTVVINEMPSSPVVAIHAWVKTGSASEGKYIGSGVTHFLEHMLFKGTKRRGVGAVPAEAKAMGGSINAGTGHDHTVFTLSVPRENFSRGLDLIADMVQNATIDPGELEREREVIVKEMHMLHDRPERYLDELVYANVYLLHPYRNPIIGYESIFRSLTRDDVTDYYRTFYVPNNMVLSVAGGVRADEILPEIRKAFADFKQRPFPARNLPREPEQISSRWVEEAYPSDLVRLSMAYQGMPLLDSDLYALDVLAMALGSGESSRLYRQLYKKDHLVETISAGNDTPVDQGFFEISCLMKTNNAQAVVAKAKTVIEEIKRRGLSSGELEKVKHQVMASNIYGRQTAEGMAARAAMEEAFTGDALFSEKYLQGVRQVTNGDIRRVASKYLTEDRLTVVVLAPPGKKESAAPASVVAPATDVEKIVLANGLTILLKEDHTLPIVSVSAVLNAGVRQEPADLGGLSTLTARVWEKGVQGKTSDDISRELESLSIGFSISAGQNSFVINLDGLSDNLGLILDHLEATLKEPTFPEAEIPKEKEQMLTALKARKDSVLQTSFKELREALFLSHPMRRDGLGSEESLARIGRKELVAWYRRFLVPGNMIITVFGDMDKAKVRASLEARFGSLPVGKVSLQAAQEPVPEALRVREIGMDKEQAALLFGFRAPDIHSSDKYAVETAVNILSSSLGGRMFKRVRDELGKAYALSGSFSPGVDAGMAVFFVLTTNENIDKVRLIMEEEFRKLAEEPVSQQELDDAKAYLKGDFARDMQTLSAQGLTSALDELLGLGFDNQKSYAVRIGSVTAKDVQTVAARYFDIRHGAVVITRSTTEKDPGKNRE